MTKFEIGSENELPKVVSSLKAKLTGRDVLLLSGPMGVGKTTFVKALVASYGSDAAISPTFALHNEYACSDGVIVDHLDLYRLESEEELEGVGFWDLFAKKTGLIIIEWPDRIPDGHLPTSWSHMNVTIAFGSDESERSFEIE